MVLMSKIRKIYCKRKMTSCYLGPVKMAAILKMAGVTTEFLARRQWQHLKWPGTTE